MRHPHIHPATQAYFLAVMANGGTYTTARYLLINKLIGDLWACGAWPKMDDAWLLVAENEVQALVSLKQHRLAAAVGSPWGMTWPVDQGIPFDGATGYLRTGYIPSSHAVAMTGTDMRAAIYERTNIAANAWPMGVSTSTNSNIRVRGRSAAANPAGGLNSAIITGSASTDSRGYVSISRSGSSYGFYRNGVAHGTATPATSDVNLPTHELYIGARNNAGVLDIGRASTIGLVVVGASLPSAAAESGEYSAWQTFMTSVGAAV